MADPVTVERPLLTLITEAIAEVLAGITVTDGYHCTISTVHRRTRLPTDYQNGQAVLDQGDGASADPEETCEGFQAFDVPYVISAFAIPSDFSTDPVDEQAAIVLGDLLTALFEDVSLGGLAVPGVRNSPIQFANMYAENGAFTGVELTIAVGYRHPIGEPFVDVPVEE